MHGILQIVPLVPEVEREISAVEGEVGCKGWRAIKSDACLNGYQPKVSENLTDTLQHLEGTTCRHWGSCGCFHLELCNKVQKGVEGRRAGLSLCGAQTIVVNTEAFTSANILSYPFYSWVFCWSHSCKTFRVPLPLVWHTPLLWGICFSQKWPCTRHEHPWLLSAVSTKQENISGFYKKLMSCRRPFLELAPQECVLFCAPAQRLRPAQEELHRADPHGGDGLTWKPPVGRKPRQLLLHTALQGFCGAACGGVWPLQRAEERGEMPSPPSPPQAPVKELSIRCSGFTNHYNDRLWQ